MKSRIALAFAVTALLAGCVSVPAPTDAPALRTTAPLVTPPHGESAEWPNDAWWERYGDATLNRLVTRALVDAPQMAAARARFESAQQNLRATGASTGVSADGVISHQRQRLSDNGLLPTDLLGFNWYGQTDVGIRLRYSFDWWGRQRALISAATWDARAAGAESRAAQLALAGAISATWYGWQADAAREQLLMREMDEHARALKISRLRLDAGLETRDAVTRLEAEQAALSRSAAALAGSRESRRIALAALVGTDGAGLPGFSPRALPTITPGLPADARLALLSRRPDVTASRWRVEAALQNVNAARAAYYPDLSLQGLAGLSSIEIGRLLRSGSAVPSLGAALNLPLFDGGLRAARHGAASAVLDAAIADYDGSVIQAAREVGAAINARAQAVAQSFAQEQQLAAAQTLLAAAEARFAAGQSHALPVIAARRALIALEDELLQLQLAMLLADIELQQALGGGFRDPGEPP